jgi:hypothetical protein
MVGPVQIFRTKKKQNLEGLIRGNNLKFNKMVLCNLHKAILTLLQFLTSDKKEI